LIKKYIKYILSVEIILGTLLLRIDGQDLTDVVILTHSEQIGTPAVNFARFSEYLGLQCRQIDLTATKFEDKLLRDDVGNYYKGIAVSSQILESEFLKKESIEIIENAISNEGVNLLIYDINTNNAALDYQIIRRLTDNRVTGISYPGDSIRNFEVSDCLPQITREFSGIHVNNHEIRAGSFIKLYSMGGDSLQILVNALNDSLRKYPIFVRYKKNKSNIFIWSCEQDEHLKRKSIEELYSPQYFSQVIPVMMFLRYVGGNECWHREIDQANLTIDDPVLTNPYGWIDFTALLTEMNNHNFHTTIAFVPWNYDHSQSVVVDLFIKNPHRYSLVMHGNNHDHYEFDEKSSLEEQEKDIIEGLNKMNKHEELTGIPYGKVMVFPHSIGLVKTLQFLKKYNFNMTVNLRDIPLDVDSAKNYYSRIEPAYMEYANFASVQRRSVQGVKAWHYNSANISEDHLPYVYDLFIDKPLLLFTHHDYFYSGITRFNTISDQINNLAGAIEWCSLGDIAQYLYLKKDNDDGCFDIRMYSNEIELSNNSDSSVIYHVKKKETLNVPISKIQVNGEEAEYTMKEGILHINTSIGGKSTIELKINYTDQIPQLTTFLSCAFTDLKKSGLRVYLLRFLSSSIRDNFLLLNKPGRAFVSLYYRKQGIAIGLFFIFGIAIISFCVAIIKKFRISKKS